MWPSPFELMKGSAARRIVQRGISSFEGATEMPIPSSEFIWSEGI